MTKHPTISIVIPTYNEELNIRRCLESIFNQQYPGILEVFIIDGGSIDNTIKIAEKFPVHILKNFLRQAEYGKKIGFMKATGTYFMILDCDMELVGNKWFEKMVYPLEKDPTIVGSWTKFISLSKDALLNKFITLDPIQRDPLFSYLTPSIGSCVVAKNDSYWIIEYEKNRLLPAGFCLFRRAQLLNTAIKDMKKYMELDNLVILSEAGQNKYAYVQRIGLHHPFLTTLDNLVRKRRRNLETMYFNQPDKRYWTWIDWNNPIHIIKLGLWVLYCYMIIPSVITGIVRCIQNRTWLGLYELPFNLVTTTAIIMSFINQGKNKLVGNIQIISDGI